MFFGLMALEAAVCCELRPSPAVPGYPPPASSLHRSSADPAGEEDSLVTLSEFVVESGSNTYAASNALSGTRYRTELVSLPKAVQVITSELLADLGATTLNEALSYASSVVPLGSPGSSPSDQQISYRGFESNVTYRNGFRTGGMIDPIFVDRLEVVKGPSSLFAGTTNPGGLVNYVTKRPTDKVRRQARLTLGSYDHRRIELESAGPLDTARRWRYQASFAADERDTHREYEHHLRYAGACQVDWRPFADTRLSIEYGAVWRDSDLAYSPPLLAPDQMSVIPMRRDVNYWGDAAKRTVWAPQLELTLEQKFGEDWSARIAFADTRSIYDERTGTFSRVVAVAANGQRTIGRTRASLQSQHNLARQGQGILLGKVALGREFGYRPAVVGEYYFEKARVLRWDTGGLGRLDIDAPIVGNTLGDLPAYNRLARDFYSWNRRYAGALTQQLSWRGDRVLLFHGVRWDKGSQTQKNTVVTNPDGYFRFDEKGISGGASVRLLEGVSAYYTYGESFQPVSNTAFDGTPLVPTVGTGYDAGLKFSTPGQRWSGSAAFYEITQNNVIRADPLHPGYNIQTGVEASRGFEADLAAAPFPWWQIVAAAAQTEAFVVSYSDQPSENGRRVLNVPGWQTSLWNRFRWEKGWAKGFGCGIGAVTFGNRRGAGPGVAETQGNKLPGYTRFDAFVSWQFSIGPVRLITTVRAQNLSDKYYYFSQTMIGAPRQLSLSLAARF